MINKYIMLSDKIILSNDVRHMKVLHESNKWAFKELCRISPAHAQRWLDKLEAIEWHNYLSEEEALLLGAKLVNENDTTRPYWEPSTLFMKIKELGLTCESMPYYNKHSLWLLMNHIHSIHYSTIKSIMKTEDAHEYFKVVYEFAHDKLTNVHNPYFIRDYFLE